MWFKTKTGLVRIEGTIEITLGRFADSRTHRPSLGIYAYRYVHPEVKIQYWWSKFLKIYNRRMYLACFPDSELGELEAAACMVQIEKAIRSNDTICDLSDFGSVADWGSGWSAFVRWPPESEPLL
jgi:hypothetical protein